VPPSAAPAARRDTAPDLAAPRIVRGRIVASANGMPLRHVRISGLGAGPQPETVFSDDDGRFAVAVTDAPRALLIVAKAGYESAFLRLQPGSTGDVDLALQRAAVITGRVVDGSGRPAQGQQVTALRLEPAADPSVAAFTGRSGAETNDRGEYRIGRLAPGRYAVGLMPFSAAAAVTAGSPGRPALPDGAVTLALSAGDESLVDLVTDYPSHGITRKTYEIGSDVLLASDGEARAIEGTVTDEHGDLLEDVSIDVFYLRRQGNRRIGTRLGASRTTDDRGRYRLFELPAGEYLVRATADAGAGVDSAPGRGYPTVFYPGTTQAEFATIVNVRSGDAADIDFRIVPGLTLRVTGTALGADGRPIKGSVNLREVSSTIGITHRSVRAGLDAAGSFVISNVPPGAYLVEASSDRVAQQPPELGMEPLTITDSDPPALVVRTNPGPSLHGQLTIEGSSDARRISIAAVSADINALDGISRRSVLTSDEQGRFQAPGVLGPVRFVVNGPSPDWFLKSVTFGGAEIGDTATDFGTLARSIDGLEIVVSSRGAALSGRVTNGSDATQTVLVVPAERGQWGVHSRRMRKVRAAADGSFTVAGLPGGDYLVAAAPGFDLLNGEWENTGVLDPIVADARTVTLIEGETLAVTVRAPDR
jgi:protocatechuate 3,4-dioxygenase beta subunit